MRERALTLSDALFPRTGILENSLVRDVILVVVFSWFVALSAQIQIRLEPLSPVPITGQTLGVLLTGALLGSKRGGLSLLAYVAQGAVGLPVFTPGATWGIARIMGPSGGYIIGFVVAAFVIGWLAERGWDRQIITMALAMLIGNVVIHIFGLPWLVFMMKKMSAAYILPYIPGDLLKLVLATIALPGAWALVRRS